MLNFKNIKHFVIILTWTILASWFLYTFIVASIGAEFNYAWLYGGNYDQSSKKIVIVKIDNKTLDALQSTDLRVLSFTKTKFADLLTRLENHGARAIGIDIVFANKSSDVNILAKVLKKYRNIVIGTKIGTDGWEQTLPLPEFSGATWGSVDTGVSSNILSRLPPFIPYKDSVVESLSMATYRKYIGDEKSQKGVIRDERYFVTPIRSVPVDGNGMMLIRFFNPPEAYPSISMIDVLTADTEARKQKLDTFFKDKIVLIGEYGTLIHDDHFSPVETRVKMPWVEFHANMIDGLIQGKTLISQSSASVWFFAILLATGLIALFYFVRTGLAIGILLFVIISLIIIGRRLIIGYDEGMVINLFFYLVISGIAFMGTYIYKFLIVDKNKRYIEGAFSRYLAPDVVKEISEDTGALKLGGEEREIAIFFSDIASFTSLSESLGTERIFTLLSEYLSEMTDILIQNKGTLDKYIGDAVMGFFWAPRVIGEPAHAACYTALAQQKRLRELNIKWEEAWYPRIMARIGINMGGAMVGNIGSKDRFSYTAIGDNVNLASRLEWVNKEYGTLICISESVYEKTKDDFYFRELDTIQVKGKNKWVKIYELLREKREIEESLKWETERRNKAKDTAIPKSPARLDDIDPENNKYKRYERGLHLYYSGKYEEAFDIFSANKEDFTSQILATRCKKILSGEIIVKDGVYEMKTK